MTLKSTGWFAFSKILTFYQTNQDTSLDGGFVGICAGLCRYTVCAPRTVVTYSFKSIRPVWLGRVTKLFTLFITFIFPLLFLLFNNDQNIVQSHTFEKQMMSFDAQENGEKKNATLSGVQGACRKKSNRNCDVSVFDFTCNQLEGCDWIH